jgi:hypothetical protein
MHGSCTCLLAISILILAPAALRGQFDDATAPDLAIQRTPRMTRPNAVRPTLVRPPTIHSPIVAPLPFPPGAPVMPPGTIGFPTLARAASTIFSGTVTAIARQPATRGHAVETVAITFHIENTIRGAVPGEDLTISQWIGLWSTGQRYRVGERVLLFLYPPSKLGLTSCVAGGIGRFAVDPWGRVLLSAQHLSAFRADPVLGGKSRLPFSDFASAVRRASEEE